MRHFLSTIFLGLILTFGQASAHDSVVVDEVVPTRQFFYEEVGLYDSVQGESKTAFMTRVAEGLLYFTTTRGLEGCGVLQLNSQGGMRVRLTTTGSQLACLRVAFREEGYIATNEFIHSHPPITKVIVNSVDSRLLGKMLGSPLTVLPPEYSPGDKANGGGWLVIAKWHFDAAQLRYLARGNSNNGYRVAKLKGVAPMPVERLGMRPYVMSANGIESKLMTVSTR